MSPAALPLNGSSGILLDVGCVSQLKYDLLPTSEEQGLEKLERSGVKRSQRTKDGVSSKCLLLRLLSADSSLSSKLGTRVKI